MGKIFVETDTDPGTSPAGCTSATVNTTRQREVAEGGSAGTTPFTIGFDASGTNRFVTLLTQAIAHTPWEAGDYVVRINVTTANMNLTWTEAWLCELTSGGTVNAIASLTGQSVSLGATGVQSLTVNRATNFTPASGTTSKLLIRLVGTNGSMSAATASLTPDQNIDTPIGGGGPQTVSATNASLTLAAQACSIAAGAITLTATAASLTVAAQNASVANPPPAQTVNATAASLTLAPQPATVTPGAVTVTATSGALALAITAPTITTGPVTVQATSASLGLSVTNPILTAAYSLQATDASLTLGITSPTVTPGPITVTATSASLTLAITSPSISQGAGDQTVTATNASLTLAPQAAAITTAYTLQATNASLTLAPQAATLTAAYSLQATATALALSITNPTVTTAYALQATNAALTLTLPDVAVAPGPVTVQGTAAALTLAASDAGVTQGGVTQTIRPASDVTTTGWTPFPAAPATYWDKLDELTPDDGDYVTSPAAPADAEPLVIAFASALAPINTTPGGTLTLRLTRV